MPLEALRAQVRRSGSLRSGVALVRHTRDALKATRRSPETVYGEEDPWSYASAGYELERYDTAIGLLGRHSGDLGRVFEVGCSEGLFTERLAGEVGHVVGGDLSEVALGRARRQCADRDNVEVLRYDVVKDAVPGGPYDGIVVMDVLCDLPWPWNATRARDHLVEALRPGGMLLMTSKTQADYVERSLWARTLLTHGARNIIDLVGRHPELIECERRRTEEHIAARFVRR